MGTSVHVQIGTRELSFGEKTLREVEQILKHSVFSCRAATKVGTFPTGTCAFSGAQHPAKTLGTGRTTER